MFAPLFSNTFTNGNHAFWNILMTTYSLFSFPQNLMLPIMLYVDPCTKGTQKLSNSTLWLYIIGNKAHKVYSWNDFITHSTNISWAHATWGTVQGKDVHTWLKPRACLQSLAGLCLAWGFLARVGTLEWNSQPGSFQYSEYFPGAMFRPML